MVWIAGNLEGFSFGDLHQKATSIRAVIRANRPSHPPQHKNLRD
jgi:hypothetical protein